MTGSGFGLEARAFPYFEMFWSRRRERSRGGSERIDVTCLRSLRASIRSSVYASRGSIGRVVQRRGYVVSRRGAHVRMGSSSRASWGRQPGAWPRRRIGNASSDRFRVGPRVCRRARFQIGLSDRRKAPAGAGAGRERCGGGGTAWSVHVLRRSHWRGSTTETRTRGDPDRSFCQQRRFQSKKQAVAINCYFRRALSPSCVFRSVEARRSHCHGARLRDHGFERNHRQGVRSPEPGEHHGTSAFASSITALTSAIAGVVRPSRVLPSEHEPRLTTPRPTLAPRQNLLRATGLFVGAILFMRNFGEQMAI